MSNFYTSANFAAAGLALLLGGFAGASPEALPGPVLSVEEAVSGLSGS